MKWQPTLSDWASLIRIIITPLVLVLLTGWEYRFWFAGFLVWIAMVSDFLDGYLARKYGWVSITGAFLDFTADKAFVISILTIFAIMGLLPAWMLLVIINRELIVMGARIFAAMEGLAVPAHFLGKVKTFFTFGGITAILVHQILLPYLEINLAWIPYLFMLIAVIMTVISGVDYLIKIRDYVGSKGN